MKAGIGGGGGGTLSAGEGDLWRLLGGEADGDRDLRCLLGDGDLLCLLGEGDARCLLGDGDLLLLLRGDLSGLGDLGRGDGGLDAFSLM